MAGMLTWQARRGVAGKVFAGNRGHGFFAAAMTAFLIVWCPAALRAGEQVPPRWGMCLSPGDSYSPDSDITLALLSVFALVDYDAVWPHPVPDNFRLKVEAAAGTAQIPDPRLVLSVGVLALAYHEPPQNKKVRPYIEGGIGLIYTDFRVEGQGLPVNFNPQAGLGMEIDAGPNRTYFIAVRFHHLSNADLYHENTGINSILFQMGFYF